MGMLKNDGSTGFQEALEVSARKWRYTENKVVSITHRVVVILYAVASAFFQNVNINFTNQVLAMNSSYSVWWWQKGSIALASYNGKFTCVSVQTGVHICLYKIKTPKAGCFCQLTLKCSPLERKSLTFSVIWKSSLVYFNTLLTLSVFKVSSKVSSFT